MGELVLVDFCFCCHIEPEEQYRDVVGTLTLMAPEVFTHYYSTKVDLWSAGVVLYLLLAGKPPWPQNPKNLDEEGKTRCERAVAAALRTNEILAAPAAVVDVLK